ncbi:Cystathionine gamma-synthase [Globisporangium polare]
MAPALALGVSLPPNSAHALSVSMPKWEHVVGYEESKKEVLDAMACGYPRFFYHPFVVALTTLLKTKAPFADFFNDATSEEEPKWNLAVSPTLAAARRLQSFLIASAKNDPKVEDVAAESDVEISGVRNLLWVVRYPHRLSATAKQFWQHSGEIVSSRHAELVLEVLNDETPTIAATIIAPRLAANRTSTHKELHKRIASLYLDESSSGSDDASANVFVYPTGMCAIFASVRLASKIRPDAKSILFGFPYVDTLKILSRAEWCASGVYFFPVCGEKELQEVEAILKREPIFGVFTEFPGNPLCSTPDLTHLARAAHENGTVLVVDDTIGSYNVNAMGHDGAGADIVTTSLSKIFSGTCDIMGGSIVLNPAGPFYSTLKQNISAEDAFIVEEDAKVLLETSVDVLTRLAKVNSSASVIAQRLQAHPLVQSIYYPELQEDPAQFTKFLSNANANARSSSNDTPQFGPLMSIVLKGGLPVATAFYDAVNIAKGPSLGTNFTICCPYTLLAHYTELDFVESCGVDRNLLRFSIGLEDTEEIWREIDSALQAATKVYVPESA